MNVPTHYMDLWRGQRDNSFNRILRNEFAARVCKTGLRLDFTCRNRMATSPWSIQSDLIRRDGRRALALYKARVSD
ncbi:MAG TPA: hypothetical protein VLM90_02575 [Candidatus Deferrimicrobium sp.]|nr:hypothetical protein [Candidatus Deferrimicrobium sp.]